MKKWRSGIQCSLAALMLMGYGGGLSGLQGSSTLAGEGPEIFKIYFSSDREGGRELFMMEMDGTNQRRLTKEVGKVYYGVATLDGAKVVFSGNVDGDQEIYIMEADGSNPLNLTNTPDANEDDPVWLPDGRILFLTDRDKNWELYAMNFNGTGVVNLTSNPADDTRLFRSYDDVETED